MSTKDIKTSSPGYFLNIYKPKGLSSFAIVQQIRKLTGEKRVGHAGTLDPLAEGVLVVAVGRKATKNLQKISSQDKEYIAEIKLGFYSATDDEEGEKTIVNVKKLPDQSAVERVLTGFIGRIKQKTPLYSAVKIKGERAYRKARRGEQFNPPSRWVNIKNIEILDYRQSQNNSTTSAKEAILKIKCTVGSGTYIRSLAREIGEKLGTGGYLTSLIRTRVGNFPITESLKIDLSNKQKTLREIKRKGLKIEQVVRNTRNNGKETTPNF